MQDVAAPNDVPANKANTIAPRQAVADIESRVNASIIGQERVVERLIIALLANGNVLVEGLPGLAKTASAPTMSSTR